MKNMLTDHPSEDVRRALLSLLDALCSWERSTGRENLLIVKDSIGCEYRSISGSGDMPKHTGDHVMLEMFENIIAKDKELKEKKRLRIFYAKRFDRGYRAKEDA